MPGVCGTSVSTKETGHGDRATWLQLNSAKEVRSKTTEGASKLAHDWISESHRSKSDKSVASTFMHYGNHGYFLKSGSRFSFHALRPSSPSSVI